MTPAERRALAEEYVSLGGAIERLNDRREAIKDELRAEGYGEHGAGELRVIVRHNRRLNAKRFTEAYPSVEFPTFYKPTPDTARIKALLPEDAAAAFYDEGTPVVVVQEAAE